MANIPEDATVHVGMRLFDGINHDTIIERVEYGGSSVRAFGSNRLQNRRMTAYKTPIRHPLSDPQTTRAGFVRECLLSLSLWPHPNILRAYGVIETESRVFLALDWAEQGSLRNAMRSAGGRLPLGVGLHLAQQIAAGLTYLHSPDPAYQRDVLLIHRALKPENILLMGDGRAVITDFGHAVLLGEDTGFDENMQPHSGHRAEEAVLLVDDEGTPAARIRTNPRHELGIPLYMAPEQWDGEQYGSTQADIFALGIMLSEMLAGRHALLDLNQPRSQAEWRRAHCDPKPHPLRAVAPDVPEVVEMIYQRCLARRPEDRPTASETLAALQAGARAAGLEAYVPHELVPHTPYNEFAYWHQCAVANDTFTFYREALALNDRALSIARQINAEHPDLLPAALVTRGKIFTALGTQALVAGDTARAGEWDRQAESAYQESLATQASPANTEVRQSQALSWRLIGDFNRERKRYAYAEDAYATALSLCPDEATAYYNRALNEVQWSQVESNAGRIEAGKGHLRQARVYAVTSLGMNYPTAAGLLKAIEVALQRFGATG